MGLIGQAIRYVCVFSVLLETLHQVFGDDNGGNDDGAPAGEQASSSTSKKGKAGKAPKDFEKLIEQAEFAANSALRDAELAAEMAKRKVLCDANEKARKEREKVAKLREQERSKKEQAEKKEAEKEEKRRERVEKAAEKRAAKEAAKEQKKDGKATKQPKEKKDKKEKENKAPKDDAAKRRKHNDDEDEDIVDDSEEHFITIKNDASLTPLPKIPAVSELALQAFAEELIRHRMTDEDRRLLAGFLKYTELPFESLCAGCDTAHPTSNFYADVVYFVPSSTPLHYPVVSLGGCTTSATVGRMPLPIHTSTAIAE